MNQAGVSTATSIVTPIIFENLKDVVLPEIDFDGGYLKNIDIKVPPPTNYGDISLSLENAGNDMNLCQQSAFYYLNLREALEQLDDAGNKKGQVNNVNYMTDIAPTISTLLGIQMPSGSIGKPILEVIQ